MSALEIYKSSHSWRQWAGTVGAIAKVASRAEELVAEGGVGMSCSITVDSPALESRFGSVDAFATGVRDADLPTVRSIQIELRSLGLTTDEKWRSIAVTIEKTKAAQGESAIPPPVRLTVNGSDRQWVERVGRAMREVLAEGAPARSLSFWQGVLLAGIAMLIGGLVWYSKVEGAKGLHGQEIPSVALACLGGLAIIAFFANIMVTPTLDLVPETRQTRRARLETVVRGRARWLGSQLISACIGAGIALLVQALTS